MLTIVMCLTADPQVCEIKEVRVDAQACFYGTRNSALPHVRDGYELRSSRCVPETRARPGTA